MESSLSLEPMLVLSMAVTKVKINLFQAGAFHWHLSHVIRKHFELDPEYRKAREYDVARKNVDEFKIMKERRGVLFVEMVGNWQNWGKRNL